MGIIKDENISRNCEEISIYAFDKLIKTQDLRWLIIGYNGRTKVDIPKEAEQAYSDIYNEYCKLTNNNKSLDYMALVVEVSSLERDYEICKTLLGTLKTSISQKARYKVVREIGHYNMMFDIRKPFEDEFKRLERQLRQKTTKINRKKAERDQIHDEDGEPMNIIKTKITLLRVLKLDRIDLKETSVIEWVEMIKEAKSVAKMKAA